MRQPHLHLTVHPRALLCVALLALSVPATAAGSAAASERDTRSVSVIVREHPSAGSGPERLVRRLGGRVGRHIQIIDAFVATVPDSRLGALESAAGVHSVTLNRRVRLSSDLDGWDQQHDPGSMFGAYMSTGADEMWNKGYTGKGVDVALIDSGVVPVNGLATTGKIVHGADLSFESQSENLRYLDTYGHGTHMAGIIAGRDNGLTRTQKDANIFQGMAPEARILSVKVADAHGLTDVSQVLAAIDWVVQHRRDNGLNIRVLNLSFGTDGVQDYQIDPLTYAAEVAWRKGIVVVVAAGNSGFGSAKLNNPAYDPFVIAVGAADGKGTYGTSDDAVPSWSSSGDGTRNPDLVAPGKSVVSLRARGSHIDLTSPAGRVGYSRFFRGSGTSQAAAVVSGAAALLIHQRPTITPDQVKALLKASATAIPGADTRAQGSGMLNLKVARDKKTPIADQLHTPATGVGSLEAARGSVHLVAENGVELRGEADIFGQPWNPLVWTAESLAETSWSSGSWSGNAWTGNAWSGNAWEANAWEANAWYGNAWEANAWEANAWSGNAWEGNAWSGNAWEANAWEGNAWESNAWAGNAWTSAAWGD
jgi:serine protease AprX